MRKLIPKQIWFSPAPFPWPVTWEVDAAYWTQALGTCDERYRALWNHIETCAAAEVPFPVPKNAKGRANTAHTTPVVAGKTPPPKRARMGDVQPNMFVPPFDMPSGFARHVDFKPTAVMPRPMLFQRDMLAWFGGLLCEPVVFTPLPRLVVPVLCAHFGSACLFASGTPPS